MPLEPVLIAVFLVEVAAMSRTSWLWAAVGMLLCGVSSRGEGLPAAGTSTAATAETIASLVEQFDRPGFSERQAASQQLEEAGAIALPQLEATAAAGSREASGRALDILKRHFESGGGDVKPAAREALERLAANGSASTAQKARDVLNPPKPSSVITPVGFQQAMPPRVNVFGRGWAPNPVPVRQVSVSNINGRKVLDIDDRERRIVMETNPRGGIQVQVTDKQNRRNPLRTFDAKDLDDLKRKDAELGRLYEQFSGPLQRQPGAIGLAPLPFGIAPGMPVKAAAPGVANQLEIIDGLLERYKQRLATDPNAQRMIDSLEQAKQRFQALLPLEEAARVVR